MMRDAGWHMIAVGRYLERALQLLQLLAATTTERRGIDVDRAVLTAVVSASESSVTHARRYRGYMRIGGVLELLLTDEANPRSLVFAVDQVADHLGQLPASTGSTRPERLVADLRAGLTDLDIAELVAIGGTTRPNLEAFTVRALAAVTRVAESVAELHLATGPAPRPMFSMPVVESIEPTGDPTDRAVDPRTG